jgi:oxygen-dependent protoporphyrinogen oxidase
MLWNIITEPVFEGLGLGTLFEFQRPRRATWAQYNNPEVDDESVASFLERRLGAPDVGNNLVSAVLHGIYAGDINQLSARSLFPKLWYGEALHGSLSKAAWNNLKTQAITESYNDIILRQELQNKISQPMNVMMAGASVYAFKQGLGALSDALEKSLRSNRNVEFKMVTAIKSVQYDDQSQGISVRLPLPL